MVCCVDAAQDVSSLFESEMCVATNSPPRRRAIYSFPEVATASTPTSVRDGVGSLRHRAMHPQLILSDNPLCADLIIAFQKCHEEVGYWGRLTGECNEPKQKMMDCFKKQKKVLRKDHLDKARADRQKWREACKELDD